MDDSYLHGIKIIYFLHLIVQLNKLTVSWPVCQYSTKMLRGYRYYKHQHTTNIYAIYTATKSQSHSETHCPHTTSILNTGILPRNISHHILNTPNSIPGTLPGHHSHTACTLQSHCLHTTNILDQYWQTAKKSHQILNTHPPSTQHLAHCQDTTVTVHSTHQLNTVTVKSSSQVIFLQTGQ